MLDLLPVEVFAQICAHLPCGRSVGRLAMTCRKMRQNVTVITDEMYARYLWQRWPFLIPLGTDLATAAGIFCGGPLRRHTSGPVKSWQQLFIALCCMENEVFAICDDVSKSSRYVDPEVVYSQLADVQTIYTNMIIPPEIAFIRAAGCGLGWRYDLQSVALEGTPGPLAADVSSQIWCAIQRHLKRQSMGAGEEITSLSLVHRVQTEPALAPLHALFGLQMRLCAVPDGIITVDCNARSSSFGRIKFLAINAWRNTSCWLAPDVFTLLGSSWSIPKTSAGNLGSDFYNIHPDDITSPDHSELVINVAVDILAQIRRSEFFSDALQTFVSTLGPQPGIEE